MSGFTDKDVPSQAGKCFAVTGANTGLGFATAQVLAARGARVLLACRTEAKAEEAMARIRAETPSADLTFVPLDQADLNSVRAAAKIITDEPRLDALVNNAGVMFPPLQRTAQGHELQFGVNHLGCFALTALLLGKLSETPDARVVVTSSAAHKGGKIDWNDIDAHQSYNRAKRYSDSKLMNLLFAKELDRRLRASGSSIIAVACHPGVASTDLGRNMPALARWAWPVLTYFLNTPEQGAWPTLQATTAPGVQGGGYFGPQGLAGAKGVSGLTDCSRDALDPIAGRRLWDISVELTGIDPGLPPA